MKYIISDGYKYEDSYWEYENSEEALEQFVRSSWYNNKTEIYHQIKPIISNEIIEKIKQKMKQERLDGIKITLKNIIDNVKGYKRMVDWRTKQLENGDWYDDYGSYWSDFSSRPYKPQKRELIKDIEHNSKLLKRDTKNIETHSKLQKLIDEGNDVLYWDDNKHNWKVKDEFGGEPWVNVDE